MPAWMRTNEKGKTTARGHFDRRRQRQAHFAKLAFDFHIGSFRASELVPGF